MFDQLSGRLEKMVKFLRGEVKVTDKNMAEALKMMRLAFLEADVNYKVVKDFEARIKEKALGEEVLSGLNPAQQVIKIVRDEMAAILGGVQKPLQFSSKPPSIIMLVGLQGSGKTTTCGKLARWVAGLGKIAPPRLVRPEEARGPGSAEDDRFGARLSLLRDDLRPHGLSAGGPEGATGLHGQPRLRSPHRRHGGPPPHRRRADG